MILLCGPCSAESFEQLYSTAEILQPFSIDYFRAGLWKPRTRPNGFEGVKEVGLAWMKQIKKDFQMKIVTEVANPYMVEKCLENDFDAIWIGARTTQNPFIVEDIATALEGTDIHVMVKNPLNPDIKLWLGAIERLEKSGVKHIMAIHRGFSLSYNRYRQSPLWRIPLELKQLRNDIPIICDPSHIAGTTELVNEIANTAIATGFDGLMLETHVNPQLALTDAKQQLDKKQLKILIDSLPIVNKNEKSETKELTMLRNQIDDIDDEIIQLLSDRMGISKQIAYIKKSTNMSIFQIDRWKTLLDSILKNAKTYDLDNDFVKEIYEIIHQESIKQQNLIITKSER